MRVDAATIEDYFVAAGPREPDLREVDRMVREAAPDLERSLFCGSSITMIGYGPMTWARPSASGPWPVVGLALQKQYISLYVAALKDGKLLPEYYRDRLGKTNNGKGCIRFRKLADVERPVLSLALREAAEWAAVQQEASEPKGTSPAPE